jgi:hypothetical protein
VWALAQVKVGVQSASSTCHLRCRTGTLYASELQAQYVGGSGSLSTTQRRSIPRLGRPAYVYTESEERSRQLQHLPAAVNIHCASRSINLLLQRWPSPWRVSKACTCHLRYGSVSSHNTLIQTNCGPLAGRYAQCGDPRFRRSSQRST